MYIEFRLPVLDGHDVQMALTCINIDIDDWVRKHDIQYHKTKIHKHTYRLCLKNKQTYSYFGLTWSPKYAASKHFSFKIP